MATNDEGAAFEENDLISLGKKLASLDLTEPERAALGALISDDDVAGFGRYNIIGGIRAGFRRIDPLGKRAQGLRAQGIRKGGIRAEFDPSEIAPKPGRF